MNFYVLGFKNILSQQLKGKKGRHVRFPAINNFDCKQQESMSKLSKCECKYATFLKSDIKEEFIFVQLVL